MIAWFWWGCGPGEPQSWVGVDQAVVLPGGRIVADVTASRVELDGTRSRKTDRCFLGLDGTVSGCVLPPRGRSSWSLVGDRLVDDRLDDGRRSVVLVDPTTLGDRAAFPVGLVVDGRVVGGAVWPGPDGGLILAANHGMAGVPTDDGGTAAWTVEAWAPGEAAPRWRRSLPRLADEVVDQDGWLVVHAGDRWRAFDRVTGAVVWEREGPGGACVGAGRLWTAEAGVVVAVELATGAEQRTEWTAPGWIASCAWVDGGALFHGGGVGAGDGWIAAPGRPTWTVPRVDLEVGAHVDGDELWINELGRGLSVVDLATGTAAGPFEVHDVFRVGGRLARYRIDATRRLTMTLETSSGRREVDRLISPKPWHADGQVLYTFASIASGPSELVRRFVLPDLGPAP